MRRAYLALFTILSLLLFSACSTGTNPSATGGNTSPAATPTTPQKSTPTASSGTSSQVDHLHLPPGFQMSVYASNMHGPRFMIIGPDGSLLIANRQSGSIVALPQGKSPLKAAGQSRVLVSGLNDPTSLAYSNGYLYIAEQTSIDRLTLSKTLQVGSLQRIVPNLPVAGQHNSRTVLIAPDKHMYVSIGSTCNVCNETDPHRAAIWQYALDGTQGQPYAKGIRNGVGLAVNPWNQQVWFDVNGRDMLGDNIPPETVYKLTAGDYGWPRCHAGTIKDPTFGQSADACAGVQQPLSKMQAHSAPLGMDFYPREMKQFPSTYQDSLYIAFHGSWNRSMPTGYKVVRIPLKNGVAAGPAQDFITGWRTGSGPIYGRPAGVTFAPDGSLFISDDLNGNIYHVWYQK